MKIGGFKIPNKSTITARTSSLTNSFIASIMPYVKPSLEDFANALKILEMDEGAISCIYCGGKHTEWDHLRPFVDKRRPTGFYTTIYNLVPACGKCNQSKGNSDWQAWIKVAHKNLSDLERRIKILKKYEAAGNLKPINVEALIGKEVFNGYMGLCGEIIEKMKEAHKVSCELNQTISKAVGLTRKRQKNRHPSRQSAKITTKDYSKFKLNESTRLLSKRKLALEIVKAYVEKHPDITFSKLKQVFPDALQKLPSFNYDVFRKYSEADTLLSGQIRYFLKDPVRLSDGDIAVCTQWARNNIERIIARARELGFVIHRAG